MQIIRTSLQKLKQKGFKRRTDIQPPDSFPASDHIVMENAGQVFQHQFSVG